MTQVIIHIDLDFFYGQVEQAANPSLISLPFAIQQKHIVVTCNYLARAAGVKKLQLLTDAKRCCPRLVIVNGEDIQRYRDASKAVFRHVRSLVGGKVQRLGMDELWLDVSEHILQHYNELKASDLETELPRTFVLSQAVKFTYAVKDFSGHVIGSTEACKEHNLLRIASHLCAFLRESIRSEFSFTSSGGVSTSKLLAKLVGDQHKPDDQTTLMPEYHQQYLDRIEVKKISGVGYKFLSILYDNLPEMVRPFKRSVEIPFEQPDSDEGESELLSGDLSDHEGNGDPQESALDDGEEFKLISKQKEELLSKNKRPLTVYEVRSRVNPELLKSWFEEEQAVWLWDILHAKDESVVVPSELYPKSIGVEDSFLHCTRLDGVRDHLINLTTDLVYRMEHDLTENGRFVRFPSILRLTPRFRGDQEKGELWRHKRTSKSVAFPVDALSSEVPATTRTETLVDKILLPLFHKIAEGRGNWDLSLLNVAVAEFKLSAPSSSISAYLNTPKNNSRSKRKASDTSTINLCPEAMDPAIWVALDEQSRQELLANEHNLAQQLGLEDVPTESKRPRLVFEPSEAQPSGMEEAWPEEDEEPAGYLCTKCSSVIPEFAIEDHTCLL